MENNISSLSEDTGPGQHLINGKGQAISRKYYLKNKTIGISISESDNLAELGFGFSHLRDTIVEVTRYILSLGGKVAYGGDMRQGGFTEIFFDLLAYYKADKDLPAHERFYNFLSWPLYLNLSKEKEAELIQNVSFVRVNPPDDINIDNKETFLAPNSPQNLYVWARCLSKMRGEMESVCDARIFAGGRTKGFKGKVPGILEELMLSLGHKHPVYLVGAFGGITRDIVSALEGKNTGIFSDNYYSDNKDYMDMISIYNDNHETEKIDYSVYFSMLEKTGLDTISKINGLSIEENRRLAVTPHISEVVYLILKGLTNCFTN